MNKGLHKMHDSHFKHFSILGINNILLKILLYPVLCVCVLATHE